MLVQWIKLRKSGEIEISEDDIPDGYRSLRGDGKLLDGVGYVIVGDVDTPHLKHKRHTFIHESN